MKRIVWFFGIAALAFVASPRKARAQRSATLQATAQVVNTRAAHNGLAGAQALTSQWQANPEQTRLETTLSHVSLSVVPAEQTLAEGEILAPRRAQLTIQYLRN